MEGDPNGEYKHLTLTGVPPVDQVKLLCGPGALGVDFRPHADRKIMLAGEPVLAAAAWLCNSRSKSQRLAVAELLLQQLFRVMTGAALLAAISWEPLGENYCTTVPEVHGVSLKLWCKTRGEDVSVFIDFASGRRGAPVASQTSLEILYTFGPVDHNDTGTCSCTMARNAIMEAQRGMIWAFGDTPGDTIQSLHDMALFLMPGLAGRALTDAASMEPWHFALQHGAFCLRYAIDHGPGEEEEELASTVSEFKHVLSTGDSAQLISWRTFPTNIKASGLIINGARFAFGLDQYIGTLVEQRGLSPSNPWCQLSEEDLDEGSGYAVLVPSGPDNKTRVLRGLKAMPERAQKAIRAEEETLRASRRPPGGDLTMPGPPATSASATDDGELPDLIDVGEAEVAEQAEEAEEEKEEAEEEAERRGIKRIREERELPPTEDREQAPSPLAPGSQDDSGVQRPAPSGPRSRDGAPSGAAPPLPGDGPAPPAAQAAEDAPAPPFGELAGPPVEAEARPVATALSRGVSDWVFEQGSARSGGGGAGGRGSVARAASLWRAGAERRRLMRVQRSRQSYSLAILRRGGVVASDVDEAERAKKLRAELFTGPQDRSSDSDSETSSSESDFDSADENYLAMPRLSVETMRRRRSKGEK